MRAVKPREITCEICSKVFVSTYPTAKYCPRCSPLAQSKEKAAMYRRYMTEGRKCLYCNSHFMPDAPDNGYCSDRCREKRKKNIAACNERNKKNSPEPVEFKPRTKKYKSPISDREQRELNKSLHIKLSPTFDPGRSLSQDEIDALLPTLTPPDRIRSVSPLYGLCASHRERWC